MIIVKTTNGDRFINDAETLQVSHGLRAGATSNSSRNTSSSNMWKRSSIPMRHKRRNGRMKARNLRNLNPSTMITWNGVANYATST